MCERASDKRIRVTMDLCASQGRTWTSRALSGTLRCSSQEEQFQLSFFFFSLGTAWRGCRRKKRKIDSRKEPVSHCRAPIRRSRCDVGRSSAKADRRQERKKEKEQRRPGDGVEQTWSISSLERCPGSMGSMGTPRTHEIQRGQAIQSELLGEDAPCARAAGVGTAVRGVPKESVQQVGCQMQAKVGELRFYGDVRSFLKQGRAAL